MYLHLKINENPFAELCFPFPDMSKFMSLEPEPDYTFSLGQTEGVMDLFDFI